MFGVKAIRKDKTLDAIITLRPWEEVKDLDRLGIEQEFVKVLGVDIPHVTIPVRPGRDIARLIEVAAFQIKLRKSGYNAAEELNKRLLAQMAANAAIPSPLSP
jgi:HPr kinase/phosphorylase